MSKTNPTDPVSAFLKQDEGWSPGHGPLTKREYFAVNAPIEELLKMYCDRQAGTCEECASLAVNYADALISELNKESNE